MPLDPEHTALAVNYITCLYTLVKMQPDRCTKIDLMLHPEVSVVIHGPLGA